MEEDEVIVSEESKTLVDLTNEILACRACLETNRKLYCLEEYKLIEPFGDLVGTPIFETDEMPQHLCAPCMALIVKFMRFRKRCQRVQSLLEEVLFQGKQITMDFIYSIDRAKYGLEYRLRRTNTLTIDTVGKLDGQDKDAEGFEAMLIQNIVPYKVPEMCLPDISPNDVTGVGEFDALPPSPSNNNDIPAEIVKESYGTKKGQPPKEKKEKDSDRGLSEEIVAFCEKNSIEILVLDLEQQRLAVKMAIEENSMKYNFACTFCGLGCKTVDKLQIHLREKHDPNAKHTCEVCYTRWDRKIMLLKHLVRHRFRFRCSQCDRWFNYIKSLKAHMEEKHHKKMLSCKYCKQDFRKALYKNHLREAHLDELSMCKYCGEFLEPCKGLHLHIRTKHSEMMYSPHACPDCKSKFSSSDALERHTTDSAASGCSEHPCAQCGASHAAEELLRMHLLEHYFRGQDLSDFKCSDCKTEFHTIRALKNHALVQPCTEYYSCQACGESCVTRAHLAIHARDEHPDRRAGCRSCGKLFHTLPLLHIHYEECQRKHIDGATDASEMQRRGGKKGRIGPRLGARTWNYDPQTGEFVKLVNGAPIKPKETVVCETCGKSVATNKISTHRNMHLKKGKVFTCAHCDKRFVNKASWQSHENWHTNTRTFQCTFCDRAFVSQSTLIKHMQRHTGDKPHICQLCEKTFVSSTEVKAHIMATHMKIRKQRIRKGPPKFKQNKVERVYPTTGQPQYVLADESFIQQQDVQNVETEFEISEQASPPKKKSKRKSDVVITETYDDDSYQENVEENVPSYDAVIQSYDDGFKRKQAKKVKVKRNEDVWTQGGFEERKVSGKKKPRFAEYENPISHDETIGAIERIQMIKDSFETPYYETDIPQDEFSNGIPVDYGEPSTIPSHRSTYGGKYPVSGKRGPIYEEESVERFRTGGKFPPSGKRPPQRVVVASRPGHGGKKGPSKHMPML